MNCKCVKYSEISSEIQQHLKKRMLIPILGSGFTRKCKSYAGEVPSGEDYKEYMISKILEKRNYDVTQKEKYEKKQFSEISTIYHKAISKEEQRKYLRDNFTKVELNEEKKKFLEIKWPYVYTLNIDDAIERNSGYENVVYPYRKIYDDIFDQEKCTIKLHGHVNDILSYEDSKCEIFDQVQYVRSIGENRVLLNKLKHDYEFLNLLYIGCSLSNEIDLLSVVSATSSNGSHYYCTASVPDEDDLILLENYGITHCVVFDSYDAIYQELIKTAEEAEKIDASDLNLNKVYEFSEMKDDFEKNKPYLFQGKSLAEKTRRIVLPAFFISREVTDDIIRNVKTCGTQVLVGRSCSGKTYVTMDVARKVVDRDVFVLQSRERVNDEAFKILIEKPNCLVITDSKALSIDQIETVIRSDRERRGKQNGFLIVENKSNRDLASLLSLLRMNEVIKEDEPFTYEVKNKFTVAENDKLNQKLVKSSFGVFLANKSLADNIIDTSAELIQKNHFEKITPRVSTVKDIACLIALATKEKVYSGDVVILNLEEEFVLQKKKAAPLIEEEGTWSFEKSNASNSTMKYVVNAEYWLYHQLDGLVKEQGGRKKVIDAYHYIVSRLIEHYGKPDLNSGLKHVPYKEYILFDNINQIFTSQNTDLIREIYERLNDLLATDPNYLHQRAKCYIRSALKTKDDIQREEWLKNAHRDAIASNKIFEMRYENYQNEKIQISAAHTLYTVALTLCYLTKQAQYSKTEWNEKTIEYLSLALLSPYNSMEFIKKDKAYNQGDIIGETIAFFAANISSLSSEKARDLVGELVKMQILEESGDMHREKRLNKIGRKSE